MRNKKLLFAYMGKFENCPRPKRLYWHLKDNNDIQVCSLDLNSIDNVKSYPIFKRSHSLFLQKLKLICQKLGFIRGAAYIDRTGYVISISKREMEQFDYIFVHDLSLLPFFIGVAEKVIFDAREFYPAQFVAANKNQALKLKIYDFYSSVLLNKVARKITVSNGIAQQYKNDYGADFTVFKSLPLSFPVRTKPPKFDEPGKINIVHHGVCLPNRSIEKLIKVGETLDDRFHLYLMLMKKSDAFFKKISALVENSERVTLLDPVAFEQIIPFIAQFDIGIHFLEDLQGQHAISLPNKFYEFISAELMLVVSGSDEMVSEAQKYDIGLAYKGMANETQIVEDMKSLTLENIEMFKHNSAEVAKALSFENAFNKLCTQLSL